MGSKDFIERLVCEGCSQPLKFRNFADHNNVHDGLRAAIEPCTNCSWKAGYINGFSEGWDKHEQFARGSQKDD